MTDIQANMAADDKHKTSKPAEAFVPGPAWRAAEAAGLDMNLVELSLAKAPWERMQDHDQALAQANLLREAMRRKHGKA